MWWRWEEKKLHQQITLARHSTHSAHLSYHPPNYRGADKSLALQGRKQARRHVRDACDFNNIETRAVIKFVFLQGKAPKEIHAILTETLANVLPGWAKDLSAPLDIIFSSSWLFPVSYVQMSVSAAYPETSSSCVLPLCCEINFEFWTAGSSPAKKCLVKHWITLASYLNV